MSDINIIKEWLLVLEPESIDNKHMNRWFDGIFKEKQPKPLKHKKIYQDIFPVILKLYHSDSINIEILQYLKRLLLLVDSDILISIICKCIVKHYGGMNELCTWLLNGLEHLSDNHTQYLMLLYEYQKERLLDDSIPQILAKLLKKHCSIYLVLLVLDQTLLFVNSFSTISSLDLIKLLKRIKQHGALVIRCFISFLTRFMHKVTLNDIEFFLERSFELSFTDAIHLSSQLLYYHSVLQSLLEIESKNSEINLIVTIKHVNNTLKFSKRQDIYHLVLFHYLRLFGVEWLQKHSVALLGISDEYSESRLRMMSLLYHGEAMQICLLEALLIVLLDDPFNTFLLHLMCYLLDSLECIGKGLSDKLLGHWMHWIKLAVNNNTESCSLIGKCMVLLTKHLNPVLFKQAIIFIVDMIQSNKESTLLMNILFDILDSCSVDMILSECQDDDCFIITDIWSLCFNNWKMIHALMRFLSLSMIKPHIEIMLLNMKQETGAIIDCLKCINALSIGNDMILPFNLISNDHINDQSYLAASIEYCIQAKDYDSISQLVDIFKNSTFTKYQDDLVKAFRLLIMNSQYDILDCLVTMSITRECSKLLLTRVLKHLKCISIKTNVKVDISFLSLLFQCIGVEDAFIISRYIDSQKTLELLYQWTWHLVSNNDILFYVDVAKLGYLENQDIINILIQDHPSILRRIILFFCNYLLSLRYMKQAVGILNLLCRMLISSDSNSIIGDIQRQVLQDAIPAWILTLKYKEDGEQYNSILLQNAFEEFKLANDPWKSIILIHQTKVSSNWDLVTCLEFLYSCWKCNESSILSSFLLVFKLPNANIKIGYDLNQCHKRYYYYSIDTEPLIPDGFIFSYKITPWFFWACHYLNQDDDNYLSNVFKHMTVTMKNNSDILRIFTMLSFYDIKDAKFREYFDIKSIIYNDPNKWIPFLIWAISRKQSEYCDGIDEKTRHDQEDNDDEERSLNHSSPLILSDLGNQISMRPIQNMLTVKYSSKLLLETLNLLNHEHVLDYQESLVELFSIIVHESTILSPSSNLHLYRIQESNSLFDIRYFGLMLLEWIINKYHGHDDFKRYHAQIITGLSIYLKDEWIKIKEKALLLLISWFQGSSNTIKLEKIFLNHVRSIKKYPIHIQQVILIVSSELGYHIPDSICIWKNVLNRGYLMSLQLEQPGFIIKSQASLYDILINLLPKRLISASLIENRCLKSFGKAFISSDNISADDANWFCGMIIFIIIMNMKKSQNCLDLPLVAFCFESLHYIIIWLIDNNKACPELILYTTQYLIKCLDLVPFHQVLSSICLDFISFIPKQKPLLLFYNSFSKNDYDILKLLKSNNNEKELKEIYKIIFSNLSLYEIDVQMKIIDLFYEWIKRIDNSVALETLDVIYKALDRVL